MIRVSRSALLPAAAASLLAACDRTPSAPLSPASSNYSSAAVSPQFAGFTPLPSSYTCTVSGGDPANPFSIPSGFTQTIIADETQMGFDENDMQAFNETGPQAYRYIFRTHELGANGGLSVTDTRTGVTQPFISRADWERLDGIRWTPWGTILFAEETYPSTLKDPQFPNAVGGLVYELDPRTKVVNARPALGSKAHEGMALDDQGNVYGISEMSGGAIFKFVPTTPGDLSSGQSYVLKITEDQGDRTGAARWVPIDQAQAEIDANVAAAAAGATGYGRPEDVEIGKDQNGLRRALYVAITSEHRVIRIELTAGTQAFVSDYVRQGSNVGTDFSSPDNLVIDPATGNLYIAEDPGGSFGGGKTIGDDVWMATPGPGRNRTASSVVRFLSLTDCDAEPTGINFDRTGANFYVHAQHRGGNGIDFDVKIAPAGGTQ